MKLAVTIFIVVVLFTWVILLSCTGKHSDISFKHFYTLSELPIITLQNNGKKLNFIIDTGANQSVINERDLHNYVYKEVYDKQYLLGIDGIKRKVTTLVDMELTRDKQVFKERFQVHDLSASLDAIGNAYGVEVNGIIGTAFLKNHKCILDFKDLVIHTKQ